MKPTSALGAPATLLALLAACASPTSGVTGACAAAAEQPPETISRSQIPEVRETASNLVLDVTSNLDKPVRLTVHVEDRLALDVRLPGTPSGCTHPPVYSYAFDLPHEEMSLAAVTDEGDRSEASLDLGAARQWAVVQLEDGFPLRVDVWDSEPQWG